MFSNTSMAILAILFQVFCPSCILISESKELKRYVSCPVEHEKIVNIKKKY